ncbi:MAG: biotin transporter BioY [Deltaproteobacteria bacterium]|jgi:biotin transport system substrate-specific component|nr:biotin transporter BioY [Deltaproteobacteria bacterium]
MNIKVNPQSTGHLVNPVVSIHRLVWIAVMGALTAVGGLVAIPINPLSPVPITLQTMFVVLSGLILGPKRGVAAVLLYILAGAIGLPIFAGGKGGLAVLIGPTGGFIVGFIVAAAFCGWASKGPAGCNFRLLVGLCLAGVSTILFLGSIWLKISLDISITKALLAGLVPFLPGEVLKSISAASIYRFLKTCRLLPS